MGIATRPGSFNSREIRIPWHSVHTASTSFGAGLIDGNKLVCRCDSHQIVAIASTRPKAGATLERMYACNFEGNEKTSLATDASQGSCGPNRIGRRVRRAVLVDCNTGSCTRSANCCRVKVVLICSCCGFRPVGIERASSEDRAVGANGTRGWLRS